MVDVALKPAQVAELLGVSRSTVMRMIRLGQIRSTRVGMNRGSIRIMRSVVDRYIAEGGPEAPPPEPNRDGSVEVEL